ncbi:hypothetical protein SCHPADRAFT_828930 [Schizopora paradoxa]|uniref:Uncharacterized protein n=1 Tax=Schizopora paradoxa TaxID=27342 RepID=A0A0H2RTP7_9AGAM|nr:hypothetical protein SCHPADRAFT_828930 [Schizopora paradoxa]
MIGRIRLSTSQSRSVISSLFTFTFFASIATVAASRLLPCPARDSRMNYADDGREHSKDFEGSNIDARRVVVEKRPSRWIQERTPSS